MTKRKDTPPPPKTKNGKNANLVRTNAFTKGTPKPPNAGRKKGTRNRTTTLLKDAILQAATLLGQDGRGKDGLVGYLKMLAIKERAVYARLLEKVLPMQVNVADNTAKTYTAEEAAERLRERGLPVPPGLLQIASGIGAAFAEDYEDELNGIGLDEIEAASDREIN